MGEHFTSPMKKSTFTRKKKAVRIAAPESDQQDKNKKQKEEEENDSQVPLAGTRISVLSGQPNISCGHSFIDSAWGGGLGLGQIALIQEDINSSYYKVLLSLGMAQALCLPEPQECLVFSSHTFLPLPKDLANKGSTFPGERAPQNTADGGKMKIAWRYDANIKERGDPSGTRRAPFSNVFDLHKELEMTERRQEVYHWEPLAPLRTQFPSDLSKAAPSSLAFFTHILTTIQQHVDRCRREKKVLRIVLQSFGSPAWLDERHPHIEKEMVRFLHGLKGIIRDSTAVVFLSFPAHLFSFSSLSKLQRTSDVVCSFDSFTGEADVEVEEAFKDYHGHFAIQKLPRMNSLTRHLPDTPSFVFARKRHKLLVEVFSLPPELSRTTESSTSQAATKMLCQSGPPKDSELDF